MNSPELTTYIFHWSLNKLAGKFTSSDKYAKRDVLSDKVTDKQVFLYNEIDVVSVEHEPEGQSAVQSSLFI